MELLIKFETEGFPADYLLSRLRGRKGRFIKNRQTPLCGPGMSRDELMREFRWVYVLMAPGLRRAFEPFFIYAELRTISLCLRFLAGKEEERLPGILASSMLSDGIKKLLTSSPDLVSAADGLGKVFLPLSPNFAGIGAALRERGLREAERLLSQAFLQYAVEAASFDSLRNFFARIIDMKNLIALWKGLRWDAGEHVSFIKGGRIREGVLNVFLRDGDISKAAGLVRQTAGCDADRPDSSDMEKVLFKWITRMLRRDREPLGRGPILNYLWQGLMETANLGLVLYSGAPDGQAAAAETAR